VLPAELTQESFAQYPPLARSLAIENLVLLRQLPTVFAALLLRELSGYDWRFPAERRMLDDQFAYLRGLPTPARDEAMRKFAAVKVSAHMQRMNWVASPQTFLDALTSQLWSTHQIGAFHDAASHYVDAWRKAIPEPPPAIPRFCVVVLDKDLYSEGAALFRRLRPHGVFFPAVNAADSWAAALAFANSRAADHPLEYGHWYIDGGTPDAKADARLKRVSWAELEPVRANVLARIRRVVESGHGGPEEVETLMGETTPKDLGFTAAREDEVLARFQVSVLTEGSGAQVFSTTFVQWAAREALRRAQPCTLLMRYRTRQRQRPMNELIAGTAEGNAVDPAGSLVDADMGAYYTWINQQRLTGAEQAAFVAWSEAHNQAVAIGPGMPKSTTSTSAPTMKQLLNYFA